MENHAGQGCGPDDIAALQMLLSGYCFNVDWGEAGDIADLFHEEAKLRPLFQGDAVIDGKAEIRRWYGEYLKNVRAPRLFVRHKIYAPHVKNLVEGPVGSMYFDSEAVPKDSKSVSVSAGRYDCRFARQEDRWVFADMTIVLYYTRSAGEMDSARRIPGPVVL